MNNIKTENNKDSILSFVWTKRLFLFANVVIVLGYAISLLINIHDLNGNDIDGGTKLSFITPIVICNVISMIMIGVCYYFENKDLIIIKHTLTKKILKLYITSYILYIALIFLGISLYIIITNINVAWFITYYQYIVVIAFVCVFSLFVIGIYRYCIAKIEISQYIRKHNDDTKK